MLLFEVNEFMQTRLSDHLSQIESLSDHLSQIESSLDPRLSECMEFEILTPLEHMST
jgi:hypothetical protein